jgi:hypothetical protein
MSDIVLDAGGIYEKAAEIAERALALPSAEAGYSIGDIADEDTVGAALLNPVLSMLLIEGTLTGCLHALVRAPQAAATILTVSMLPPDGTEATVRVTDMEAARNLLAKSLAGPLDDSQRSALLRAEHPAIIRDSARTSAVMLGLVHLSSEVLVTQA